MKLVVLESPYAGDIKRNIKYARRCVRDSLYRGEAPLVSHLLYTQPDILSDHLPGERALGLHAGHVWIPVCEYMVVYQDHGVSPGMQQGIAIATAHKKDIFYRKLFP